jgi:hypothetical protein
MGCSAGRVTLAFVMTGVLSLPAAAGDRAISSPSLGPLVDISLSSDRNGHPDAVWTGNEQELLAVWELERTMKDHRTSILAARVATSGSILDSWYVADAFEEHRSAPVIAFSSVQQSGLVVYTRDAGAGDGLDIWARAAYQSHKQLSNEFLVAGGAFDQVRPAIAYNPLQDEFVVVAVSETAAGFEQVIAVRLSAADPSSLLAFEIVATEGGLYPSVAVAFNEFWNMYVIAYVHSASQAEAEVVGKYAGYSLGNVGSATEIPINVEATSFPSSVAVAATGNEFLVSWMQAVTTGPDTEVRARRLAANGGGALGDAAGMAVGTVASPGNPRTVDVAAGIDGYLVVWDTDDGGDSDVASRYVLAGEDTVGGGYALADGADGQSAPAVACSPELDCLTVYVDQMAAKAPAMTEIIRGRFLFQSRIFISDFESGDTGQWSTAIP